MGIVVGTQAQITYVPETTRGLTPTTPAMKVLRTITRNINLKKDTLESQEVTISRQRSDVRHGFGRIDGPLQFQLCMTAFDDWLAYLMARPNDVSAAVTPADDTAANGDFGASSHYNGWFQPAKRTNVSVQAVVVATGTAPGTITFRIGNAGNSTNWTSLGYRPGDWVVSAGFTDADNNSGGSSGGGNGAPAQWRVLNIINNIPTTPFSDLICQIPPGFLGQATEAAGAGKSIDYVGRKLSVGRTLTTMTIERGFVEPVNPIYQVYPGCGIASLALDIRPDAIINGTFNVIGGLSGPGLSTAVINNTSSVDASPDAAAQNSPFSAFDGVVGLVKSDGTHITASMTQMSLTIDNQRTLLPVVGQRFSGDLYEGVAKVSGNMTLLLEHRDHLTAFQDESSLSTVVVRFNELGTTDFMSMVLNRVKYLSADIDPPQNGPCLIQIPFESLEQSFTGFSGTVLSRETIRFQRSTTA